MPYTGLISPLISVAVEIEVHEVDSSGSSEELEELGIECTAGASWHKTQELHQLLISFCGVCFQNTENAQPDLYKD